MIIVVVLAQELTVSVPPDPVGSIVRVLALVVAAGTEVLTFIQGQAIKKIETREQPRLWLRCRREPDQTVAAISIIACRHLRLECHPADRQKRQGTRKCREESRRTR